ncbi:hypothetical protein FBU30_003365 [Linnemannia zychae]|nr:hypothetical protein FBU30_003365 [Linnemannia zychae]
MDPSLQEFYSLSRSTSQQRPFTQIISSNDLDSRSAGHQPIRRPASALAWAQQHQPMSVPSMAQIWIQPGHLQQPFHSNTQDDHRQASRHRRHHTAGDNILFGSAPVRIGSSTPTPVPTPTRRYSSAALAHENEMIPYDPFAASSLRTSSTPLVPSTPLSSCVGQSSLNPSRTAQDPSIYSQDDAHSRRQDHDFPHLENLEELDEYGSYSQNDRDHRGSFQQGGNASTYDEDEQWNQGPSEEIFSVPYPPPTPTPLPKIPLFVLTSSFFFAQFCTSIFWGYMSDRHGRRPILLLGLCGSTIACIFFGLSKSLVWAIVSRSMCGLLNGNVGVAKSMLGEIADSTNQSQAFSIFGFAWGIGMIVGPVLGGYLANPAKNFPEIFGNWPFFIEYPYFLPCLTAALGSVIGFIVGFFFLEETRGKRGGKNIDTNKESDDDNNNGNSFNLSHPFDRSDYQNAQDEEQDSYGQDDMSNDLNAARKTEDRSHDISDMDIDLEQQPLILPPNATQAQQIKSSNRRDMEHSSQYGSMATLTFDIGSSSIPLQPQYHSYGTASARSTLSRRPIAARSSLFNHNSLTSDAGNMRPSSSYVERPSSPTPIHPSIYTYNPSISTGYLHSLVETPVGHALPADTASLSHYGYTIDPVYLGNHTRASSYNHGRQSRLSAAPSQVYILPPDPNNKDHNQPIQLLVVQQAEAGLSPTAISTIVAYAMLALHSIIFEEVYTLYAVTPVASHGLGWSAIQLSTSLACMGIVQLGMQFVVYPMLERRYSAVWLFRITQLVYCCVYLSFPMIRAFVVDESDTETGGQIARVRYIVLIGLVFKYFCSVFSYTSVMVMITNSSPPHLLGTVNGIGQTSASFMRAFGPALGGIFWAWSLGNKLSFPFNYFFVFFLMATIATLGFIHSFSIPLELGRKKF